MANLDGSEWRYVVKTNLPHTFALSIFEDYLYWTDWEFKSVERAHKYNGSMQRVNLTHTIHRPMGIQIYHPYRQHPIKNNWINPCLNNGDCREGALCLLKPDGLDRVCGCPQHHILTPDKLGQLKKSAFYRNTCMQIAAYCIHIYMYHIWMSGEKSNKSEH